MENVSRQMENMKCINSAGHIHLSTEANRLLTMMDPQFKTECRGEVIIKVRYSAFGQSTSCFRAKE